MWREKPDGQPLPNHPLQERTQYRTHGGARTTHHCPGARAAGFSSRLRQHRERRAVTAWGGSSGRGLGRVLVKWPVRQAPRFGYHGTRSPRGFSQPEWCALIAIRRASSRTVRFGYAATFLPPSYRRLCR